MVSRDYVIFRRMVTITFCRKPKGFGGEIHDPNYVVGQRSANYSPRVKSSSLTVFVNKVLLKHNHTMYLPMVWLFSHYKGCGKDHVAHETETIYSPALYRKKYLTLVLNK